MANLTKLALGFSVDVAPLLNSLNMPKLHSLELGIQDDPRGEVMGKLTQAKLQWGKLASLAVKGDSTASVAARLLGRTQSLETLTWDGACTAVEGDMVSLASADLSSLTTLRANHGQAQSTSPLEAVVTNGANASLRVVELPALSKGFNMGENIKELRILRPVAVRECIRILGVQGSQLQCAAFALKNAEDFGAVLPLCVAQVRELQRVLLKCPGLLDFGPIRELFPMTDPDDCFIDTSPMTF